jgi:hypothetical protein
MDNAGENKLLQQRAESKDWKLNIQYEYTACDMPQQNHLAELTLAMMANKGRACMTAANVPETLRYLLYHTAFQYATDTGGLGVHTIGDVTSTRCTHFCGQNPNFAQHHRTWGVAGIVKIKTKTTPKLGDRGVQCMFVGYAKDHEGDCVQMWDPKTKRMHVTRDIIWLRRMFYTTKVPEPEIAINPTEVVDQDDDDDDHDEDLKDMPPLIPQNQSSGESDDEDEDSSDKEESDDEDEMIGQATTRSRHNVNVPERYREPGLASMALEELDCIDFSAEHVQAEIAAAVIEARDFEPTLCSSSRGKGL